MTTTQVHPQDAAWAIRKAVKSAIKSSTYHELIGERRGLPLRYARMVIGRAAREAIAELDEVMNHTHVWNRETDYCEICGQDGRA